MDEFIKTGTFDKDAGKLYSDLFDLRQEGDYSDFVTYEENIITSLIDKSEELISLIDNYLKNNP